MSVCQKLGLINLWHPKLTSKVRFWHFLTNRNSLTDLNKKSFKCVDSWPKLLLLIRTQYLWNSTAELISRPSHLFSPSSKAGIIRKQNGKNDGWLEKRSQQPAVLRKSKKYENTAILPSVRQLDHIWAWEKRLLMSFIIFILVFRNLPDDLH